MSARARRRAGAAIALLAPLALYLATLAPSVVLVDSGELALAVRDLAPGHPPGFPLYVLVHHPLAWLPGDLAHHLNVASALWQSLAAMLLYLLFLDLLVAPGPLAAAAPPVKGRRDGKRRREERAPRAPADAAPTGVGAEPSALDVAAALCGALGFAVCRAPWRWAVVTEVYGFHDALLALALLACWRAAARPSPRGAGLAGLALGVATSNHLSVVVLVPVLLGAVVLAGEAPQRLRALASSGGGFAAGLLPYAALPLMAGADPLFCWGDPTSLERFLRHVSGWQYRVNLVYRAPDPAALLGANLRRLLEVLPRQHSWPWILLGVAGLVAIPHRGVRRAALALAAVNVLYGLGYQIAEDWDAYFLPLLMALALGAAVALRRLASREPRLLAAGLLLVAYGLARNAGPCSHRGFDLPTLLARDALGRLPQNALVLTREWQLYAPSLYLQHVAGFRPDVTVIDTELVRRPWYLDHVARIAPDLVAATAADEVEFREALVPFERDGAFDAERLTRLYHAILNGWLAARAGRAYVGLDMERGVGAGLQPAADGILFRLAPELPAEPPPWPELAGEAALLAGGMPEAEALEKVVRLYTDMRLSHAMLAGVRGKPAVARADVEAALRLSPDRADVEAMLGRLPPP